MVLGNPAQRLHQILVSFDSAAGANVPIANCWRTALECSAAELPACFQSALLLVAEIETRIESQDLAPQRALLDRYQDAWLKPFMPDRGWQTRSDNLIDADSLLALTSLSAIFAALDPRPVSVGAEQSQVLLGLVDEARAAVREAGDVPPDLRTVIMDRLHDVQWAIEHYKIHGPEGLQAALDRLGAEMARTSTQRGSWRRKAGKALFYGLLLFSNLDDFVSNIEAGSTIINEVTDWAQDARELTMPDRLELPSADTTEPEDDDSEVVDAELVDEHEG